MLAVIVLLARVSTFTPGETTAKYVSFEGQERKYLVYYPNSAGSATPSVLVICLHGVWLTAQHAMQSMCKPYADERNYVAVAPEGSADYRPIPYPFSDGMTELPNLGWNSFYPDNYAAWTADDVTFIVHVSLLVRTELETLIEPSAQVYVLGFSFGGDMAIRLLCEASDHFDGFGISGIQLAWSEGPRSSSSTLNNLDWARDCAPSVLRPVWMAGGTDDQLYGGVFLDSWIEFLRATYNCSGDYETVLGGESDHHVCYHADKCHADVPHYAPPTFCSYNGLEHVWPGDDDTNYEPEVVTVIGNYTSCCAYNYRGNLTPGIAYPATRAALDFFTAPAPLAPPPALPLPPALPPPSSPSSSPSGFLASAAAFVQSIYCFLQQLPFPLGFSFKLIFTPSKFIFNLLGFDIEDCE